MAVLDQNIACFRFFEEICAIPHGSHNEQAISDWLMAFAHRRGIQAVQEPCGNVIMKVPATAGYENAPAVMLQAHMDMVCARTADSTHDFLKDPLDLYVEDGWLKARGTTLGADDGCGVAMILAALDKEDLKHPALECVFTTTEETGMFGAQALDTGLLEAKRMICLDATGENIVLTASAGGCRVQVEKYVLRTQNRGRGLRIAISGLLGGHSGVFAAAGRGNANKLLGRFLSALYSREVPCTLVRISGGDKDNAIPAAAEAELLCADIEKARQILLELEQQLKTELFPVDKDWRVDITEVETGNPICEEDSLALVQLLRLLPDGVTAMSRQVENLPQISNNLGVVTTAENCVRFEISIRSGGESEMQELTERIMMTAQLCGAKAEAGGAYPAVAYMGDSPFRQLYGEIMEQVWHRQIKTLAVHAGAEAGYFARKIPGIEIVTLGPMMEDVHSPMERLDLASFEKCAAFLLDVLERLDR